MNSCKNTKINNSEDDYGNYRKLGGEVESRNAEHRIGMTPEQRRATLLAETEDVAREDQIFLMENSGVSAMGSTVVKRKADIAVKLQGKDISPTQLKVVDAFTTDVNNIAIDVVDANGKQRNITLKQGQDNKAGVKHSVLKHYETASNSYTAEEILLIPQVIEQGERRQDGKKISYKMNINGVTYSVTTEIKGNHEEFTNFFTNKKPTIEEQGSLNTANQHEQPQQSVSTDKGSDNIGDVQEDAKYSLRSQEARKVATDAVVEMLGNSGIEVVRVSDAEVQEMLRLGGMEMSAKKKRALETASVQEENQPTVVSSADGTKVLNNLDNVANEYEEKSNQPKTFLGDVAKALGAERKGSGSQYVTFETKNGKVVTIRLSNHNATVSNFDNNGEAEGISIVVSAKGNNGIINDGDAHIVEYYYDAIKLRRAEGKPLADIVRSIKQALYSGEFEDTTGLAERQEVNLNNPEFHIVYHGSGAKFDAFDHSHMGEGEGAQAYGWGTYVTEAKGIGEQYALTMRDKKISDKHKENAIINNLARQTLTSNKGNNAEALDYLRGLLNEPWSDKKRVKAQIKIIETGKFLPETKVKALLYIVDIPEDNGSNYLYYNKVVPKEVLEELQNNLSLPKGYFYSGYPMTGKRVYNALSGLLQGDKAASEFLSRVGFAGIKYPAQYTSGGREDGASNYVIFNEADAKIVNRVEFLKTPQGVVYGWTDGKKVYLTEKGMNPETPIHEYTHLWARAMMQGNPEGWQSVKDLLRGTPVWNEVISDANYADIRENADAVASEALSRLSGRENAERMMQEAQKMIDNAKGIFEKANAVSLVDRMRRALKEFWSWVDKNLFGIEKFNSIEEVTDRVLYDLMEGTELGTSEGAVKMQTIEGEDVKYSLRDNQGNPIDEDGKLIVEQVSSIDEITDADFDSPTRSIQLPSIPPKVDEAIGANGKPIVIKKNVFEKNKKSHKDLTPKDSRAILLNTLYSPDLYGQNQKITRPYNWILIHLADTNTAVLVEVNENKDNVEIVNWHYINDDAIERKKKQAIREGGLILTLESAAADTSNFLPSADKVNNNLGENQENDTKFSLRSKGVLHPDLTDTDGTRAKYNERVGSSEFKWREGYQDSMLSLKVLQEIIAEKHGLKEIPSWQNAYVEENEMSSRNKAMSDIYRRLRDNNLYLFANL